MTPVEWVGIIAGSSVLSSSVTAFIARRSSMAAVFADNYRAVIERLAQVEGRVTSLERDLSHERMNHGQTKDLLRIALRYVREAVAWASGPRHTEFPPPAPELMKEL